MSSRQIQSFLFLFLLGAPLAALEAAPSGSGATRQFESANHLYESRDYRKAAEAYEEIVESGARHGTLFYNLGDAWQKAGEPARAVLNFRRALLLDPADKEALQNWRVVADENASLPPPRRPILLWIPPLPDNLLLAGITLAFWTAVIALVLGATTRRSTGAPPVNLNRRCVWTAGSAAGIACLLLAFFLLNRWRSPPQSVQMTVEETPVRSAPYADAQSLTTLDPGADVRVLRGRGPWNYVKIPTGRTGWVAADTIEQVRIW